MATNPWKRMPWREDPYLDRLGLRIQAARKALNWNADRLAHESGVNVGVIRLLESHKAEVLLSHVRAFAFAMGMPVAKLLDVEADDPRPNGPVAYETWAMRVVAPEEKKIMERYRALRGRERTFIRILMEQLVATRGPQRAFRRHVTDM